MIKDVMVRLDGSAADEVRLSAVNDIADLFDSQVTGLFLNVMPLVVAPEDGVGAMAALLGIELEPAQEACKEAALGEVVAVANDNGGGQVVVSGHKEAVERTIEVAKTKGAKRGMLLPVSAPFHCPLMQPAADAMKAALETVSLTTPRVPLVANVLAAEITEPTAIKQRLVEQVTGLVRWRESVQYMKSQGVEMLVECGSGKVLSGLARRIDKDLTGLALNTPADIEAFLKTA